ncbi:MAG: extracellular solute-binding protein [Gammaproteobacteria bacterium]|nr:extracellular solute-binding protein [Gammaproteobacteria bacterium]
MSNHRITRRDFIRKSTAASAGVVAASQLGMWGADVQAAQDFKGEELRVFTYAGAWGDQFTKNFAPLFNEMTGADLIVELGWWDSIPKLKASPPGNPAFDLIMTDATQGYPAIREGLFQKVNMGNVPNAGKFAPEVMSNWVVEESWGVTWPDAAQTGVFNTEDVAEAPARWSQLLDPKYDNKLGMYNSFYFSLFTFACMMVDQDGNAGTARDVCNSDLGKVLEFAKSQRDRVNYWWPSSSDMALNLVQKNVIMGNIHSVDAFTPVREGEPIGVFVPGKDRASFQALWLVSKDTKKNALAEKAIDIFCGEQFQEIYASDGGFPTAIPSVAAKVGASDELWAQINPYKPEHFQNVGYYPYDAYFAQWDHIVEVWDKEVLRKS